MKRSLGETAQSRLMPQMEDYTALASKLIWHPYVMYFQPPGFRSAAVNTDDFGFRRSIGPNGEVLPFRADPGREINLLVGNSVAFGIGATRDAASLASRLAAHTDEPWLNFCGRAFSAFQEWLLFHFHRPLVGSIRRVVIVSGLNDLTLFFAPSKDIDEVYGSFFLSDHFSKQMNRPELGVKRAILRRLLFPIFGDRINWAAPRPFLARKPDNGGSTIEAALGERMQHRHLIVDRIAQSLELWAEAGRRHGFETVYALQPMQPWLRKPIAAEEAALIAEQDQAGSRWTDLLRLVLRPDLHEWYADEIRKVCQGHGIGFLDMNRNMQSQTAEWYFADRVHLTDLGQDRLAAALADGLKS